MLDGISFLLARDIPGPTGEAEKEGQKTRSHSPRFLSSPQGPLLQP